MIIGTTPTFTLKLKNAKNINLTEATNIYATLKQRTTILTKTGNDLDIVDANTIRFSLTQAESLNFALDKSIELQVNWTYSDGKRSATKVIEIILEKQLLKQELT